MFRHYRALPIEMSSLFDVGVYRVLAETDLDAADRVKAHYGADMPFVLWDGERKALTYKPLAYVMRLKGV